MVGVTASRIFLHQELSSGRKLIYINNVVNIKASWNQNCHSNIFIENTYTSPDFDMELIGKPDFNDHVKNYDHALNIETDKCRKYNNIVMLPVHNSLHFDNKSADFVFFPLINIKFIINKYSFRPYVSINSRISS